jgi:hypothetical protein
VKHEGGPDVSFGLEPKSLKGFEGEIRIDRVRRAEVLDVRGPKPV